MYGTGSSIKAIKQTTASFSAQRIVHGTLQTVLDAQSGTALSWRKAAPGYRGINMK
jgi:hypothetical protein